MHGLEYVKGELEKRGCMKSQVNARVVPMVLDIVAGTDRAWTDYDEAAKSLEFERMNFASAKMTAKGLADAERRRRVAENCGIIKEREELAKERAAFAAELEAVETTAAKDRVRLAKFFMKNTAPNDKSNTAYIYGLGAILGGVSWSDHFQDRED